MTPVVVIFGAGPCHSSLYFSKTLVANDVSIFPTMPVAGHASPKGMDAKGWALEAFRGSQPSLHHRSGMKDLGLLHCFSDLLVTPWARTMSTC